MNRNRIYTIKRIRREEIMKVILLSDIKGVGKKDQVIEASDGYARNYLFPKKLAQEATDANLHILNNIFL